MVVGPRRGGKSSFGLIAKNELEKNGDFKCVRAHEESSIKRVILTYYFTFSDDEVKKRAEQRIAEVSLAELPDVIQEITGWDGASWSNKKLLLDSDEGLDILAHYGNSDELMGLVKFIKRAKELKLPINTLSIVTNFHFQNIMSQLTEHPDNVEHAHLSAFSVEEFGLFTPEESRHLLESLLDRINTEFKTPDDRKRFIDEMIRNCSGQVEVLNLVVGLLEETGDQEQIYSNMQRNNTEYFGIYLKKMTPAQRILIASLCLAQDHRGVMRSPQANMEEVKQMQSAGYVDYHFRDAGKQTLAVHLITPEGFKLAIREAFKDLIYKLAHTHFNAYLQTRDDIDEATIELGNKLIFKDEVGTEEYARYQKAYETVRSAEADFQEIFWQAAKEGRLDINLAYKKDEA